MQSAKGSQRYIIVPSTFLESRFPQLTVPPLRIKVSTQIPRQLDSPFDEGRTEQLCFWRRVVGEHICYLEAVGFCELMSYLLGRRHFGVRTHV